MAIQKHIQEKPQEWENLADDQLTINTVELKQNIPAMKLKKIKDGKIIEARTPAHVRKISLDVVMVINVVKHKNGVIEQ